MPHDDFFDLMQEAGVLAGREAAVVRGGAPRPASTRWSRETIANMSERLPAAVAPVPLKTV